MRVLLLQMFVHFAYRAKIRISQDGTESEDSMNDYSEA